MTGSRHRGFTLVELSLVMAFFSVLLLAILTTTLQMGKVYTKGVTNKAINQVGRDLSDMLRRDFLAASADAVVIPEKMGEATATSGRVCLGTVSYVWNTADLLSEANASTITKAGKPIVFERVDDSAAALCVAEDAGTYVSDIPAEMTSTELLANDGRSLAVYDMSITKLASDAGRGLYRVTITIGTNDLSATQRDESQSVQCKPPSDNSSDFNYCSVADFDIIVRTGGGER